MQTSSKIKAILHTHTVLGIESESSLVAVCIRSQHVKAVAVAAAISIGIEQREGSSKARHIAEGGERERTSILSLFGPFSH